MEAYAGCGYLAELPELLPPEAVERIQKENRLIRTAGMLWTDEISFEDNESGQGLVKPYVLDICDCSRWVTGRERDSRLSGSRIGEPSRKDGDRVYCGADGKIDCRDQLV